MKIRIVFLFVVVLGIGPMQAFSNYMDPDSVYLFSYATAKNNQHNGLHFAWSNDQNQWVSIGNEYGFLKSDYGRWGSEKRMISPFLFLAKDGSWHCIWTLNATDKVFAHAASLDLINWGRQAYVGIKEGVNFLDPVIVFDEKKNDYSIRYRSNSAQYFQIITSNFKTYDASQSIEYEQYKNPSQSIQINGSVVSGQVHRVAWKVVEQLIQFSALSQYREQLNSENVHHDAERFKNLKQISARIMIQPEKAKPISDLLMGVFFEDLNYAADGGLYAELIQNRGFEYKLSDKEGRDQSWTSTYSWTLKGKHATFNIDSVAPIHMNNAHYAVLDLQSPGAVLVNNGFDGIVLKKDQAYTLSLFAKVMSGSGKKLQVSLVDSNGIVLASTILDGLSSHWKKITAVLIPDADQDHAVLQLKPMSSGKLGLDMVSLFPAQTFKGRSNGLRADLAQAIADIHPRFVRFPGGCVAHGDGLGNMYRWKNTIGPLESRVPQRNLWGYHQSVGLGYFEYFQFCEDIGAAPVPVLAAAVPCQNSGTGGAGQQGGLPLDQMDAYIQDVMDLVEYANGSIHTKWGKVRAAAGHPKPFHLKYIGIGNEDLISDVFEERFTMIYHAMQKAHPEITIIGTAGPFSEGTDYVQGWDLATKLKVPVVDEHYYQLPGWFIHNQHYYDSYDRSKSAVYLGEYASRGNTLYNALSEAIYLTAIERNGDVVRMASYAPLLAKDKHAQWNPDLIYFNNTSVKPSVNYYVQQLFGQNSGNEYLPSTIQLSDATEAVTKRVAVSITRDTMQHHLIVKLVNLLPVAVQTSLDFGGVKIDATKKVEKYELYGDPSDKKAQPVSSEINIEDQPILKLLPYSLVVLKISL